MSLTDLSNLGFEGLLAKEWLATNGLGGYASSTAISLHTRKYHGLLVAPLTPPHRRLVLLSRMEESFFINGGRYSISCNEYPDTVHPRGHEYLRAFNHEPFPRWAYQGDGWTIEKSLRLLEGQNTVVLCYTLLGGGSPVEMEIRPLYALRTIHELMFQWSGKLVVQDKGPRHHRISATARTPEVFFAHDGEYEDQPYWYLNTIYRREKERGYGGLEDLWSPGIIRSTLNPGQSLHFVCSIDPIDFDQTVIAAARQYSRPALSAGLAGCAPQADALPLRLSLVPEETPTPGTSTDTAAPTVADATLETLLHAAQQFVVRDPQGRTSLIATYPWPSPDVRTALSSLTGLLLVPGKLAEAQSLLQHVFDHVKDGLTPSDFPENGSAPVYHAADNSLWLIKAADNYLRYSGDDATLLTRWLDASLAILQTYRRGAGLGISVDARGLISSTMPGTGTSWMDAAIDGWVITPRPGQPVELNALWHNALCTVANWCDRAGRADVADDLRAQARQAKISFNASFWNEAANCCFDVLEGHGRDPSIRPNQLLASALPHPILADEFESAVLATVRQHLLTPVGLRTLSPDDPAYQGHYGGNVIARDRAYHNGTAYPFLLGWYAKALLRVEGNSPATREQIRTLLLPCLAHLAETGQLCELFDGNAPHAPGGAMASARNVGELLRCYVEDVLAMEPATNRSAPADTDDIPQAVQG